MWRSPLHEAVYPHGLIRERGTMTGLFQVGVMERYVTQGRLTDREVDEPDHSYVELHLDYRDGKLVEKTLRTMSSKGTSVGTPVVWKATP